MLVSSLNKIPIYWGMHLFLLHPPGLSTSPHTSWQTHTLDWLLRSKVCVPSAQLFLEQFRRGSVTSSPVQYFTAGVSV